MTSLPVWSARAHRSLRCVVFDIQHGSDLVRPPIPAFYISQTIDLDMILQKSRGMNICVPAAHLRSSASEPETPSIVYSTAYDADALRGVFISQCCLFSNHMLTSNMKYLLGFSLFKVSLNEVK